MVTPRTWDYAMRDQDGTSIPPTLTMTFTGNGDIPCACVMSGTAERPRSDDVCVIMTFRLFVSVVVRSEVNLARSATAKGQIVRANIMR